MTCCNHCLDAERFFDRRTGRRELRRYRRRGPIRSTRLLIDALLDEEISGASLLDVGGGVGAVQFELLRAGLGRATHVDASAAYLEIAAAEAQRRGFGDRVNHIHGDFVAAANGVPVADFVTLDRVLCCYPDLEALLAAAAGRTGRVLGIVYPRERWGTRVAMALGNAFLRLRKRDFQVFLHPPDRIDALITARGFRCERVARTFLWEVATYIREA